MLKIMQSYVLTNWPTFAIGILGLTVIVLGLILLDKGDSTLGRLKTVMAVVVGLYKRFISFHWLITLAAWLRQTGSNISESAFMVATIYVSIDFVAPQLVKWVLPVQDWRAGMAELCSIAFTILPELILIASLMEVWKHVVMWRNGGGKRSMAWAVAYGLPTLFFLVMAVYTLGSAVIPHDADKTTLPNFILVARAMAGFAYCIVQAIYAKGDDYSTLINGIKAETKTALNALKTVEETAKNQTEKMAFLERQLKESQTKNDQMKTALNALQPVEETAKDQAGKIAFLEQQLKESQEQNNQLLAEMQRKAKQENAVNEEGNPEEIMEWLRSLGRSTIALSEANTVMKLSKRRMDNAVKRGEIRPTKNKEIVFIDSLIEWYCKELSLPITEKLSSAPALKLVPGSEVNKLEITMDALKENPNILDEELAVLLNIKRPASARFWRLKAVEILNATPVIESSDPDVAAQ